LGYSKNIMDAPNTLQQAIQWFTETENCRKFMVQVRWPDGVVKCPTCGATKLTWLANAKVYRCYENHPKQKFSLKVGTVFEDSPIGLDKWLPAVWLLVNAKNGISSYELHRALGVTQKTAWFMLHRIRVAMKNNSFRKLGSTGGPVEVDETFVGGKPKNMHASRRLKLQTAVHGHGDHKTIVMGMLDRDAREVRTKVIPNVKRETLQSEILRQVQGAGTVYSDQHYGYDNLKAQQFIHETVNHLEEYVRGEVHTQGMENFWSLLKRTLSGTYVAVEPFHLDAYADEQAFRYNNRATRDNQLDDSDRFMLAVSQIAGKRLTYAELTGKVGERTF
jgi:transposase-like protein